jgi:hypothetical protein
LELTRRLRQLRERSEAKRQLSMQVLEQRSCADSFANLRDELDGVLAMLGFIEERPPAERR